MYPPRSCHELWKANPNLPNGTYQVTAPASKWTTAGYMRVYCRFNNAPGPEQGGWTLVSYLGTIPTTKAG